MTKSGMHNVVVRFLAGMCGDDKDSHCYQELVKLLDNKMEVAEYYGYWCLQWHC